MSDVVEGIGGAIEGALLGGAVEEEKGGKSDAGLEPVTCSNCGASVTGMYCHKCGQKRDVHRTISAILHDLIHGVLHLDGKFWLTLPLLIFKPGKLTRRYIEGERAKFVSPMAMFLFSVFAMFAVFQVLGLSVPSDLERNISGAMLEEGENRLGELRSELETIGADDPRREDIESEIKTTEIGLEDLREKENVDIGENVSVNLTGIEALDKGLVKKWRENPSLMFYKLQANGYKFSWLLIPLSVPFVWLIFAWRRRFKAYDHAIFVTYSLAFTSLLFIVISLLFMFEPLAWLGGLLLVFVPPIHLYKHLRGTYEIGRFSAIWRLFALSAFIWIVIGLFLQTLLLLGAF